MAKDEFTIVQIGRQNDTPGLRSPCEYRLVIKTRGIHIDRRDIESGGAKRGNAVPGEVFIRQESHFTAPPSVRRRILVPRHTPLRTP